MAQMNKAKASMGVGLAGIDVDVAGIGDGTIGMN